MIDKFNRLGKYTPIGMTIEVKRRSILPMVKSTIKALNDADTNLNTSLSTIKSMYSYVEGVAKSTGKDNYSNNAFRVRYQDSEMANRVEINNNIEGWKEFSDEVFNSNDIGITSIYYNAFAPYLISNGNTFEVPHVVVPDTVTSEQKFYYKKIAENNGEPDIKIVSHLGTNLNGEDVYAFAKITYKVAETNTIPLDESTTSFTDKVEYRFLMLDRLSSKWSDGPTDVYYKNNKICTLNDIIATEAGTENQFDSKNELRLGLYNGESVDEAYFKRIMFKTTDSDTLYCVILNGSDVFGMTILRYNTDRRSWDIVISTQDVRVYSEGIVGFWNKYKDVLTGEEELNYLLCNKFGFDEVFVYDGQNVKAYAVYMVGNIGDWIQIRENVTYRLGRNGSYALSTAITSYGNHNFEATKNMMFSINILIHKKTSNMYEYHFQIDFNTESEGLYKMTYTSDFIDSLKSTSSSLSIPTVATSKAFVLADIGSTSNSLGYHDRSRDLGQRSDGSYMIDGYLSTVNYIKLFDLNGCFFSYFANSKLINGWDANSFATPMPYMLAKLYSPSISVIAVNKDKTPANTVKVLTKYRVSWLNLKSGSTTKGCKTIDYGDNTSTTVVSETNGYVKADTDIYQDEKTIGMPTTFTMSYIDIDFIFFDTANEEAISNFYNNGYEPGVNDDVWRAESKCTNPSKKVCNEYSGLHVGARRVYPLTFSKARDEPSGTDTANTQTSIYHRHFEDDYNIHGFSTGSSECASFASRSLFRVFCDGNSFDISNKWGNQLPLRSSIHSILRPSYHPDYLLTGDHPDSSKQTKGAIDKVYAKYNTYKNIRENINYESGISPYAGYTIGEHYIVRRDTDMKIDTTVNYKEIDSSLMQKNPDRFNFYPSHSDKFQFSSLLNSMTFIRYTTDNDENNDELIWLPNMSNYGIGSTSRIPVHPSKQNQIKYMEIAGETPAPSRDTGMPATQMRALSDDFIVTTKITANYKYHIHPMRAKSGGLEFINGPIGGNGSVLKTRRNEKKILNPISFFRNSYCKTDFDMDLYGAKGRGKDVYSLIPFIATDGTDDYIVMCDMGQITSIHGLATTGDRFEGSYSYDNGTARSSTTETVTNPGFSVDTALTTPITYKTIINGGNSNKISVKSFKLKNKDTIADIVLRVNTGDNYRKNNLPTVSDSSLGYVDPYGFFNCTRVTGGDSPNKKNGNEYDRTVSSRYSCYNSKQQAPKYDRDDHWLDMANALAITQTHAGLSGVSVLRNGDNGWVDGFSPVDPTAGVGGIGYFTATDKFLDDYRDHKSGTTTPVGKGRPNNSPRHSINPSGVYGGNLSGRTDIPYNNDVTIQAIIIRKDGSSEIHDLYTISKDESVNNPFTHYSKDLDDGNRIPVVFVKKNDENLLEMSSSVDKSVYQAPSKIFFKIDTTDLTEDHGLYFDVILKRINNDRHNEVKIPMKIEFYKNGYNIGSIDEFNGGNYISKENLLIVGSTIKSTYSYDEQNKKTVNRPSVNTSINGIIIDNDANSRYSYTVNLYPKHVEENGKKYNYLELTVYHPMIKDIFITDKGLFVPDPYNVKTNKKVGLTGPNLWDLHYNTPDSENPYFSVSVLKDNYIVEKSKLVTDKTDQTSGDYIGFTTSNDVEIRNIQHTKVDGSSEEFIVTTVDTLPAGIENPVSMLNGTFHVEINMNNPDNPISNSDYDHTSMWRLSEPVQIN